MEGEATKMIFKKKIFSDPKSGNACFCCVLEGENIFLNKNLISFLVLHS